VIGTKAVLALVYSRRMHVISLSAIQTADAPTDPTLRRSINGYNLVSWSDGGVTYWAASDLNHGELITFAKLFRAAPG
jgi:anti-sigma factor RsiW